MATRLLAVAASFLAVFSGVANAAEPQPWQMNLPAPVSPIAQQAYDFHTYWLMPVITIITLFVLALLLYTCYRFRASANPTPSKTTHNAPLEVIWTLVPALILVVLVFPSMQLLYASDKSQDADMTIKIIGNQWYWSYEYPDHGNFTFDALLVARTAEEAEAENAARLMDTDNVVVLPIDTKIRLLMTSNDVLHNWSVSDFGVRMDTVPGRLNESWVLIEKPGTYYGFCSELCGTDHAYMPITVKAVPQDEFETWVTWAQQEFETVAGSPVQENVRVADSTAR